MSLNKVLALVFWDSKIVIMVDYLQKGTTINSTYYCILLRRLRDEIKKNGPGMLSRKVLLHQDNAHILRNDGSNQWLWIWIISTPPYSPDLAPSDFYVFPNLKKHLGGQKFSSLEEIDVTVNENFATTKHFLKMV